MAGTAGQKKKSSSARPGFWGNPFRVFLLFAAGIILPSGLLSFFGFRSFQYEGLLLQKQSEERYAAAADAARRKAEESFAGLTSSLRRAAGDEFRRWDLPAMTLQTLALQRLEDLPVRQAYLFDASMDLAVPFRKDVPPETPPEPDWGPHQEEIRRLERLEFMEKNAGEAVKGYLALERLPLAPALQAALLKNIAGAYRKLNDARGVETAYFDLVRRFDQLPDPAGYPAGILGRQLLAKFYDATGRKDQAMALRLELAEKLLLSHWVLPQAQRQRLLQESEAALSSSAAAGSEDALARWRRLLKTRGKLDALQASAEEFLRRDWPAVLRRLRELDRLDRGGVFRLSGDDRLAVVCPVLDAEGRRRGHWVAVADAAPLWQSLDKSLAEQAGLSGARAEWKKDPAAGALLSSWKEGLTRTVDAVDPPLAFHFQGESSAQDELLRRRRRIYGGMVGLSFLVVLAGLGLMFHAIRRELENADLKAEFVANVSHELKTPLASIAYIGERLKAGRYRSEQEARDFFDMLNAEAGRLKDLIENILDFSKMAGGRQTYRKAPLDLAEVAREAHERFRGKAEARGFAVRLELPGEAVPAEADRRAVVQAAMNLLDNALKYSGDSREIVLSLSERDGGAALSVRDSGIGIPRSEQQKIFEKFYRVEHALSRDTEGGVGLGLAMVKHIMEGHGGKVTVESEPGKGSTFSLRFPSISLSLEGRGRPKAG